MLDWSVMTDTHDGYICGTHLDKFSSRVTEFRDMLMNNAAILRSSGEHVRESEL